MQLNSHKVLIVAAHCIFCGNPPESRTKEHIYPQWLLKMTGFHSKDTSVGTNWVTGKEIIFPGKNYTFPACDACNNNFSGLEGRVKGIVERLSEDESVTGEDLEILLDWFDKLRAGTWLGVSYMNKSVFSLPPNHYINDRVGVKDRYLSITNTYLSEKTLKWSGANSLSFMSSPTALMVRINNLVFVSASTDFLVAHSVGFPYPEFEAVFPDSNIGNWGIIQGTQRILPHCFDITPYTPYYTLRQPIFKNALESNPALYDNSFVADHSHDVSAGIGKIFLQKNNATSILSRDTEVNFTMEHAKKTFGHVYVVKPILELQLEMLATRFKKLKFISEAEKLKQTVAAQAIVDYTKEQIRQYRY